MIVRRFYIWVLSSSVTLVIKDHFSPCKAEIPTARDDTCRLGAWTHIGIPLGQYVLLWCVLILKRRLGLRCLMPLSQNNYDKTVSMLPYWVKVIGV